MSSLMQLVTRSPRQLLGQSCLPLLLISSPPVRFAKMERLYGHEEGHGLKNEFRSDYRLRKKRARPTGEAFRASVGLPPNPFKTHSLATRPDWSFRDGSPGYLTSAQSDAVDIMKQLCDDVRKAIKVVDKKV